VIFFSYFPSLAPPLPLSVLASCADRSTIQTYGNWHISMH